jgi:hypothetical protein
MVSRAISSLALLKVNSDRGTDYIDNFVPFVAECLRKSPHDLISISELQGSLKAEFGLDIPQGPLRTILDRAVRRGMAERDQRVYRRRAEALTRSSFQEDRDRAVREENALVRRLITFSGARLGTDWSEVDAENALLHYLADRGGSLLASASAQIPLSLPDKSPSNAQYVLSAFVRHLNDEDPEGFGYLTTAVKGSILASVLYFDDLGSVTRHFQRLDVFLDTTLLLQALGRLGPERQTASRELLILAQDLGARLRCFRDTLQELDGIHRFTAYSLRFRGPGKKELWGAAEYLVGAGYSASDVDLMAEHLERDLRDMGVSIVERPAHVVALTVDEVELASRLKALVRYSSDEPMQHDLDALTAIHRLRDGRAMPKIENARAVFVTTNTSLARAAVGFFRDEYGVRQFAPVCMADHQFATLAWLKKPLRVPDLPTKYVLADAFAGLNPPEGVWRDYIKEINKLESRGGIAAEDYYLLRYTPAAKEALMGITVGGSRPLLEGSVPEILARVRAAERADVQRRLDEERAAKDRLQDEFETQRLASAGELAALQAAYEAETRRLREDAARREATFEEQRLRRRGRQVHAGRTAGRAARTVVVAILVLFAALQFYANLPSKPLGDLPLWLPSHPIFLIGSLVVGTLAILMSIRGDGIASLLLPLEEAVAWRVTALVTRLEESE